VSNGKQALALVARTLRARGTRTVLMPRYRCEAMAVPFALEGMRVLPVDVGADLLLDPCVLSEALDRAPGAAGGSTRVAADASLLGRWQACSGLHLTEISIFRCRPRLSKSEHGP